MKEGVSGLLYYNLLNVVFEDAFVSEDINFLAWVPTKLMGMGEGVEMMGLCNKTKQRH